MLAHIMSAVLSKASGKRLIDYMRTALFEPLGFDTRRIQWSFDPAGYNLGGSELWLTPRDMAKLGVLYLNNGKWGDNQVIPANWVEESTRNQLPDTVNNKYGYWWWPKPQGIFTAEGWGMVSEIYLTLISSPSRI